MIVTRKSMLSFTKGTPVAVICDGDLDGKKVHITDEADKPDRSLEEEDLYDVLDEDDFKLSATMLKLMRPAERMRMRRALIERQEPEEDDLVEPYHRGLNRIDQALKMELVLPTGFMIPLPSKETERVYIAGKSGSGKSTLAAMYMREYKDMFPKRRVILISRHSGEKTYDKIEHVAIPIEAFNPGKVEDEEYEPLDLPDIKDSLVVFDDTDNIQDKKISQAVLKLNEDIISNGRKYNIHVLTLAHQLMDYKRTRNQLNEANRIVFFNTGSTYHIEQFLTKYAGLAKDVIKRIKCLPSRWTMISMGHPMYILHEHGIFIVPRG